MTISSVSQNNVSLPQLTLNPADGVGTSGGCGNTGSASDAARKPSLFDSVIQALSQVGGTDVSSAISVGNGSSTTASSDDSSSQTDIHDALRDFMQQLMGALHSQNTAGGSSESSTDSDATTNVSAVGKAGAYRRHVHGHVGQELQSLIQQLAASDSGDSSATGDLSTASTTNSTGNSALQQSFDKLMSALGVDNTNGSNSQPTLSGFLQALSGDISSANGKVGVVDVHA